jgi:LuxR family transcriptional regulator
LAQLSALAPSGYALGLHIRFASAQIMVNTYDPNWVEIYTNRGYMLCDPLISWGFGTEDVARWSALNHPDPHEVLGQAKAHSLTYGVAVARGPTSSRTIGGLVATTANSPTLRWLKSPKWCACGSRKPKRPNLSQPLRLKHCG